MNWTDDLSRKPVNEGTYENMRRIVYGDSGATFVPVCEKCGRFVKANDSIMVNDAVGLKDEPNAICKKCGPTTMIFEGFY